MAVKRVKAFHLLPSWGSWSNLTKPRPLPTSVSTVKKDATPFTFPLKSTAATAGLRVALLPSISIDVIRLPFGADVKKETILSGPFRE